MLGTIWHSYLSFPVSLLLVLTIVVFIHEMGHFLVARWCGVKVSAFSIGFGREIWGFTDAKGTRWKLAWLPLGGYVKFADDENVASAPSKQALERMSSDEREGAFQTKPLLHRAAIVIAGPLFNIVSAVLFFVIMFWAIGVDGRNSVIDVVRPGSPADKAGIRAGDRVVGIDGYSHQVDRYIELLRPVPRNRLQLEDELRPLVERDPDVALPSHAVNVLVERNGRIEQRSVVVEPPALKRETEQERDQRLRNATTKCTDAKVADIDACVRKADFEHRRREAGRRLDQFLNGLLPEAMGFGKHMPARIGLVRDGSPAARGGLERNDVIIGVDGQPISHFGELQHLISNNQGTPVAITVRRGGQEVALRVQPQADESGIRRIGISPRHEAERRFSLIDSTRFGLRDLAYYTEEILRGIPRLPAAIAKVLSFQKQNDIGGPIAIAETSKYAVDSGFSGFVNWIAMFSVMLGIMNLLPIPMLDGGHLMFYAIEAVRGKPLDERKQEIGFRIGIAVVATLMIAALLGDVTRLFGRLF